MSDGIHKSPKGCQEHRQGWNEMALGALRRFTLEEPLQTVTHPYQPRRVAREQRFDWMSKRPSDRGSARPWSLRYFEELFCRGRTTEVKNGVLSPLQGSFSLPQIAGVLPLPVVLTPFQGSDIMLFIFSHLLNNGVHEWNGLKPVWHRKSV